MDISDAVNFCPINGSYLLAYVTLSCTASPQEEVECEVDGNLKTVDWYSLLFESDNDGISPQVDISAFVMNNNIGINIDVTSEYIVTSKYELVENYYKYIYQNTAHEGNLPVTYLLTFEEFNDFSQRQLDEPGSCDNRLASSYASFNTSTDYVYNYWTFATDIGVDTLGNDDYMEYPNGNVWTVSFNPSNNTNVKCGSVTWTTSLTLSDLLNNDNSGCSKSNGDSAFSFQDDTDSLRLLGILYLYMVSPDPLLLANMDTSTIDELQTNYLHHGVVNFPISIDFNKVSSCTAVSDDVGVDQLTMLGTHLYL